MCKDTCVCVCTNNFLKRAFSLIISEIHGTFFLLFFFMSPSSKDVETQMLLLGVSVINQNKVLGSSAYIPAEQTSQWPHVTGVHLVFAQAKIHLHKLKWEQPPEEICISLGHLTKGPWSISKR